MTRRDRTRRLPHLAARIGEDYADSFAACRELLASMFDLQEPAPELHGRYGIGFSLYDFGPIKLGTSLSTAGVPWTMVRSLPVIARTGTDQFHIQYYRSGGFVMTLDGVERRVEPGDVCLLDLSRPVMLQIEQFDNLSAIVDRALLAPLLADVEDVHGLVLSRDSEVGIALREHLDDLWQRGPELTVEEGLEQSRSTAALLASIVRAKTLNRHAARVELRRSQFRAICRRIDRDIADPDLGPDRLIQAFHVTRPTLYRMFAPHGGIGRFILSRRLAGVFRDLSNPTILQDKIEMVLHQWGLTNHTAGGRAFRDAYGMTPSECRLRARDRGPAGGANPNAFDIPDEMPAKVAAFKRRVE